MNSSSGQTKRWGIATTAVLSLCNTCSLWKVSHMIQLDSGLHFPLINWQHTYMPLQSPRRRCLLLQFRWQEKGRKRLKGTHSLSLPPRLAGIVSTALVLKQDFNPRVVNNFVARVAKGFAIPRIVMYWEIQVKNLDDGTYDESKTGCSQIRSKTLL